MTLRVISLGWGVQSWGLAAMSALGELPPVDFAIHADTGWERKETYAFAERWTPWLEGHKVSVKIVKHADAGKLSDNHGGLFIPAHTTYEDGRPSGMMHRQCTRHWKIAEIKRWLQKNRDGEQVEQWIGITLDEIHRAKESGVQYIVNRHPYLEMLDRPWTRGMVIQWLKENDLEVPVSSSCVFCPFHDDLTWRRIKMSENGDWKKAVKVDKEIRNIRTGYKCYLHSSRIPLEKVRLGIEQLEMW